MKSVEKIVFLLFLLAVLGIAASKVGDFDLFWQLQSGRFMLDNARIIDRDTFTLAADIFRWEHCWLHDILVYGAFALAGYSGISLLKGVVIAATALALAGAARVRGGSWPAILLTLPPFFLLTTLMWSERPQLWTFLFFALFLLVLESFAARGGRTVFLLVPLMVLWANLHGGFMLAFPLFGAFLVGEGLAVGFRKSDLTARDFRMTLLVFVLLLLALFMTPYGLEPFKSLIKAGSLGRGGIYSNNMDWRPTPFNQFAWYYYAMGAAGLILLAGWRKIRIRDLLLLAGLGYMGIKFLRHTPFFLFAAAALLPACLEQVFAGIADRVRWNRIYLQGLGVALALFLIFHFGRPAYNHFGFFNLGFDNWRLPVQAAEFIRQNKIPGNLYHTFQTGGYLEWTLFPDYLVFWDGRATSEELMSDGWGAAHGGSRYAPIFKARGVNTVIIEACSFEQGMPLPLVEQLRNDDAWALVSVEDAFLVFVRRAATDPQWLSSHELPKVRVDDGVLNAVQRVVRENPKGSVAYEQMARIYLEKRDYRKAFEAITVYRQVSPVRNPQLEEFFKVLSPMFSH